MDLRKLKEHFPADDIEWRIGRSGVKGEEVWAMALAYITARAIHDRLDDVCGEANWQLRYAEHLGETICEIGIKPHDEWIWKAGGAGKTEFEAFKGGLSSAEKRAGVPWGIGRYLYNFKETFVKTSREKVDGWNYQPANKSEKKPVPAFWWKTPDLPKWALPTITPDTDPETIPQTVTPEQQKLAVMPPLTPEKSSEPKTPVKQPDHFNDLVDYFNKVTQAKFDWLCKDKALSDSEKISLAAFARGSGKTAKELCDNFGNVLSDFIEKKF